MNKKALAILIISALGFLIATLVFYSNLGSRQPGPDSSYLGHNAMIIFQIYYEAESRLRSSWPKIIICRQITSAISQALAYFLADIFNANQGTKNL